MITGFNPTVSNSRNQRQNFKALPVKIANDDAEARMFLTKIKKGTVKLSDSDKNDLVALENSTKDPGIKTYFTEALEFLGVKKPKQ